MHHVKPTPADLMQRMTEPLSPSWLASALGVSPQTVHRWKHGKHVTEERLAEVAVEVRRLLPEHKELAAPDWERLERTVYAIAERLGVSEAARRSVLATAPELLAPEADDDPPESSVPGSVHS